MAVYSITVKGTKHKLEVDSDKISDDLCAYIFQKGLDSILGRGRTKLGKPEDHKSVEAFTTEAVKIAEAQVADLYAGKTRMVGGAKASKGKATAEQTEALRLAKDYTKAQIKAQGLKISRYSAKDITSAAKAYLDMDPEYFLAAARENLAKAAQASVKGAINLSEIMKESPAKVSAAEAKTKPKAAPKAPIPAKPAQRPQPRA